MSVTLPSSAQDAAVADCAAGRLGRLPPAARVVVGVDDSRRSGAALRWAAGEASRRGAALRIVSAWDVAGPDPAPSGGPHPAVVAAASRVQAALEQLLREDCCPHPVGRVVARGLPGTVLVEQARGAGLLVLGGDPGEMPGTISAHCRRFARLPQRRMRGAAAAGWTRA